MPVRVQHDISIAAADNGPKRVAVALSAMTAVAGLAIWGLGMPAASATPDTTTCVAGTCTLTFPAGAATDWTVPAGVNAVTATVDGAAGGSRPGSADGGKGGTVRATIPVTPGTTLTAVAGSAGANNTYIDDPANPPAPTAAFGGGGRGGVGVSAVGAGGGGGSFLFAGATVLIAAGGGGGAGTGGEGGAGGGADGQSSGGDGGAILADESGSGASGTAAGSGGGASLYPGDPGNGPAIAASALGDGGDAVNTYAAGGGGAGYYGGGGGGFGQLGGSAIAGAGGGGSGYLISTASLLTTQRGANGGDGSVVISYPDPRSTTVLSVDPSDGVAAGASITLTATITAANPSAPKPTGTATFYDGSDVLGTATVDPGTATLTTTLSAGTHTLSVSYGGTSGLLASNSSAVTYVVSAATTPAGPSTGSADSGSASTAGPSESSVPLADTGENTGRPLSLGIALLLSGALVLTAAGRRRRARRAR